MSSSTRPYAEVSLPAIRLTRSSGHRSAHGHHGPACPAGGPWATGIRGRPPPERGAAARTDRRRHRSDPTISVGRLRRVHRARLPRGRGDRRAGHRPVRHGYARVVAARPLTRRSTTLFGRVVRRCRRSLGCDAPSSSGGWKRRGTAASPGRVGRPRRSPDRLWHGRDDHRPQRVDGPCINAAHHRSRRRLHRSTACARRGARGGHQDRLG